jgi:hypothetical protein
MILLLARHSSIRALVVVRLAGQALSTIPALDARTAGCRSLDVDLSKAWAELPRSRHGHLSRG